MRALEKMSSEHVYAALEKSPNAAQELFWDHEFEPPLCCAVRCECDTAIMNMLLEHGADPEVSNAMGLTPAQLLGQQPRMMPMSWHQEVAALLDRQA